MSTTPSEPSIALGEDYREIREAIRAICADFPGEYWRELDARDGYPEEFVNVLAEQGYLAVLIPEEYGGSGLHDAGRGRDPRGVPRGRLLRRGLPRADVHDGDAAAPRQCRSRRRHYLPRIASGELRLQAFGVTEPTSGHRHDEAPDPRRPRRRSLPGDRPEGLDLEGAALRPDAAARPHDADRRGREEDARACRCS